MSTLAVSPGAKLPVMLTLKVAVSAASSLMLAVEAIAKLNAVSFSVMLVVSF